MRLTFDAATHSYELDGQRIGRSVTEVLQHSGLIDFSGVPQYVLDHARQRGAIVHQALHYYNEGDLDLKRFAADYPDHLGYLEAWQFFREARAFVPVLCEHRIASRLYDCAGTIDCLGLLEGRPALIDFATGNPADVAKHLQTAAYVGLSLDWQQHDPALAAFFRDHGMVIGRYAIALRPDGTFSVEKYSDHLDWAKFRVLLEARRIVDAWRLQQRKPVAV